MANKKQVKPEMPLKDRMAQRKENYLLRLDTHIDMFNQSLSRNAPVLSQLVSALTVGYALYEGVARWMGAPTWAAVLVGVIAAGAIETVGFMAVDERDQGEAHNRRTADAARHVDVTKANAYVSATFWITLSIVAVVEALPALWFAYRGTATFGEVLFRCSLLLFPLLSRLGANLYAFRSVRLAADTSVDDQELRALQLELTKKEMVAESEQRVKLQRKNMTKAADINVVKHPELQGKMDNITLNSGYNGEGNIAVANDGKQRKITERHDAIVTLCHMYGAMSAPELSKKLMDDRGIKASAQTVGDDCRRLVEEKRLVTVGKKWDVPRIVAEQLPAQVEFSTNGHSRH